MSNDYKDFTKLEDNIVDSKVEESIDVIIKESIEELEANEKTNSENDRFKEVEKLARKKKPFDKIKDELKIQSKLNKVHDSILTNRDISMKSESKILEVAERNNKGIVTMNNKFNKIVYALLVIFFLLGVVTGMADEGWKPYLADLLSIAKTSSNIIR